MAIPDYQTIMLPLVKLLADGRERKVRDTIDALADEFRLTLEERNHRLPSGLAPTFANRVGWARSYLTKARVLEAPRRGLVRISKRGSDLLAEAPPRIDVRLLERYPEFLAFRERRRGAARDEIPSAEAAEVEAPQEALARAHRQLREALEDDLLQQIRDASPGFFERLVVDLLLAMGYGGSQREAGSAIGRSGDEGIDGVIKEDRLGLDVVYIQAKRWRGEATVGRPDLQKFAGALQGQRARKGVFITTGSFSREARDYAAKIDSRIILIDGDELARLLVDHGVGVSTVAVYDVKRIDADYFAED